MDGIHDLGGRQGYGSLTARDEAGHHESWELRIRSIAGLLIARGCWNVDAFRHAIERIDPREYFAVGYFGRWLLANETLVAEAEGRPQPGLYPDPTAAREIEAAPRFAVGDAVLTRNLHRAGHTRLPGYARARRGVIALRHGGWVFPDSHAHGEGEQAQHVYAVRFDGRELWGESAEPGIGVCVDLFESYLEPA